MFLGNTINANVRTEVIAARAAAKEKEKGEGRGGWGVGVKGEQELTVFGVKARERAMLSSAAQTGAEIRL